MIINVHFMYLKNNSFWEKCKRIFISYHLNNNKNNVIKNCLNVKCQIYKIIKKINYFSLLREYFTTKIKIIYNWITVVYILFRRLVSVRLKVCSKHHRLGEIYFKSLIPRFVYWFLNSFLVIFKLLFLILSYWYKFIELFDYYKRKYVIEINSWKPEVNFEMGTFWKYCSNIQYYNYFLSWNSSMKYY